MTVLSPEALGEQPIPTTSTSYQPHFIHTINRYTFLSRDIKPIGKEAGRYLLRDTNLGHPRHGLLTDQLLPLLLTARLTIFAFCFLILLARKPPSILKGFFLLFVSC